MKVLPEVNYDMIYRGKENLTDEHIKNLFLFDIKKYEEKTRNLITGFDDFPNYLKIALVDMTYRGDLGDSPKFRELFNSGEYLKAGSEYINREEYRSAKEDKMRGLIIRMDSNKKRIWRYAENLKK
jgi:hypothetical protein